MNTRAKAAAVKKNVCAFKHAPKEHIKICPERTSAKYAPKEHSKMKSKAQAANDVQMARLAQRGHQIAHTRQARALLVNTLVEHQLFVIHAVQGNTSEKKDKKT